MQIPCLNSSEGFLFDKWSDCHTTQQDVSDFLFESNKIFGESVSCWFIIIYRKNFIFFMKLFCKNFLKKFCRIKLNSYICIVIENKV